MRALFPALIGWLLFCFFLGILSQAAREVAKSSGIYAEGSGRQGRFHQRRLPNPGTSNWEFPNISGSAEPGLQGLILQQQ